MAVRSDLTVGDQIAQAVHAGIDYAMQHPDLLTDWQTVSQYLVVVAAPDESTLHDLTRRATKRNIHYREWREPDADNQVMAVAFEPGEQARRVCSNLPLAGRVRQDQAVMNRR